jgi:hypothetical protein
VEPSARVMVLSLPVIPVPAVAGPFTGGQICAQPPLQLDLVAVSGANHYFTWRPPVLSSAAPMIASLPLSLPQPISQLQEVRHRLGRPRAGVRRPKCSAGW